MARCVKALRHGSELVCLGIGANDTQTAPWEAVKNKGRSRRHSFTGPLAWLRDKVACRRGQVDGGCEGRGARQKTGHGLQTEQLNPIMRGGAF